MKLNQFILLAVLVFGVAACAQTGQPVNNQNASVELPNATHSRHDLPYGMTHQGGDNMDMAKLMSNPNVIVYPVDDNAAAQTQEFPAYRGVMENTTASGYTVFDPSVTVYAVDGNANARPSYLPEYSVPRYAEQYAKQTNELTPMDMASVPADTMPMALSGGIVAEPLDAPRAPMLTTAMPTPRAPNRTEVGRVSGPVHDLDVVSKKADLPMAEPRRSRPVLTGY